LLVGAHLPFCFFSVVPALRLLPDPRSPRARLAFFRFFFSRRPPAAGDADPAAAVSSISAVGATGAAGTAVPFFRRFLVLFFDGNRKSVRVGDGDSSSAAAAAAVDELAAAVAAAEAAVAAAAAAFRPRRRGREGDTGAAAAEGLLDCSLATGDSKPFRSPPQSPAVPSMRPPLMAERPRASSPPPAPTLGDADRRRGPRPFAKPTAPDETAELCDRARVRDVLGDLAFSFSAAASVRTGVNGSKVHSTMRHVSRRPHGKMCTMQSWPTTISPVDSSEAL